MYGKKFRLFKVLTWSQGRACVRNVPGIFSYTGNKKLNETLSDKVCGKRCFNVEEIAYYVGLSPNGFLKEVEKGTLPQPLRFGTRKVWDLKAIDHTLDGWSGLLEEDAPLDATKKALQRVNRKGRR